MRLLKRNLRPIWVAYPQNRTPIIDESGYDTGEYQEIISDPQALLVNISPASGAIARELFGNVDNCSHIILSDIKIDKTARIWYNQEITDEDYYVVTREFPSLNVHAIGVIKRD